MNLSLSKIKILSVLLCTISLLVIGCNSTHYNISPKAEKYLEEVLTLLKEKSINKHEINWHEFNNDVFHFAQNSQTIEDTYPAINYAVNNLKDNHSYFYPVTRDSDDIDEKPLPLPKDEITPSDIGYVRLPFCIGDEEQTLVYIQSVADKISNQNNEKIKGWIIDLRDNFGGNMWPMMAAVGSVLYTGTQGYFFDADNKATEWHYENGRVYADNAMRAENKNIVSLYGKDKIAVLVNGQTASSGEAMAVLFKGYSTVSLFGTPTFGVSTGCEPFIFSDGSRINLATSVFTDRNKEKYGGAIMPDIPCSESETLSKAIEWIYK